jgi:hypothetical protein
MVFDADSSVITLGGSATQLLSRSATSVKAIAHKGYIGRATVSNVTWLGSATTGDYDVGEVETTDSVTVARVRFLGTATVSNWVYGTNNLITLTPGPGTAFRTAAPLSTVAMEGVNLTILSMTPAQITAITPTTFTGPVRVTNLDYGSTILDSLYTPADRVITASYFPGTVVNGAGTMLDTVKVWAGGGAVTFGTTSAVLVNGTAMFIIRSTADSVVGIARLSGTAAVQVNNPSVAGSPAPPSLLTQGTIAVGPATGEQNEPGNDAAATGTVVAAPVNVNDTVYTYGVSSTGSDIDDFFRFTPGTTGNYRVIVDWVTAGIDIDAFILSGTGGSFCVIDGCAGATGADPEVMNGALTGGTTYTVLVEMFDAHGLVVPITYRLRIIRTS